MIIMETSWAPSALRKGPYLNDVYMGRGVPKCRHSKGGCVDLVQWSPVIRAMLNSSALLIVQNWPGMERIDYS